MTEKPDAPEGARTVGRVLAALELIAGARGPLRLVEIARELSMPPSSAHALLQQLIKHDYVQESEGQARRYEQGSALTLLGSRALGSIELIKVARPVVQDLAARMGENTYLGMRHTRGITYVDKVEDTFGLMMRFPLGMQRPLHASGPGKLYLAFCVAPRALDDFLGSEPLQAFTRHTTTSRSALRRHLEDIRRYGYAVNEQEVVDGAFGVSAPIFDSNDTFIGCVTLGIPGVRFQDRKDNAIAEVTAAGAEISRRMGNDRWRDVIRSFHEQETGPAGARSSA